MSDSRPFSRKGRVGLSGLELAQQTQSSTMARRLQKVCARWCGEAWCSVTWYRRRSCEQARRIWEWRARRASFFSAIALRPMLGASGRCIRNIFSFFLFFIPLFSLGFYFGPKCYCWCCLLVLAGAAVLLLTTRNLVLNSSSTRCTWYQV